MEANKSILIIGPPNSGKTTFLAQLFIRLDLGEGKVKLSQTPDDISGIEKAVDRLSEGLETETTPSSENLDIPIQLIIDEDKFETKFMDYGGEQIKNISELLEYDNNWLKRTKDHDRWVVFIRPNEIYHHYDLSVSGYAEIESDNNAEDAPQNKLSDQYHFIELIQALLHARGIGVKSEIVNPKLLIVLTCFDELNTKKLPSEILKEKMPLFEQFIETIWSSNSLKIIGLSSQGFALDNEKARKKYMEEMPESFGHLILDDNQQEDDLTCLIDIAIKL